MKVTLDLHVHTELSHDGRMTLSEIAALARQRGLDGVAICDHDRVHTGPDRVDGILMIPGVEFSTPYGHILGLFVREEMAFTTLEETARRVHDQGGLLVLAHPFQHRRDGAALRPIVPLLDGVEVWNSRADRKNPRANAQALAFQREHGLWPTAGSDAHLPREVGGGRLTLTVEENTPAAIRAALIRGDGTAAGQRGRAMDVARSQYTKLKKTHASPARYGKWAAFAAKCAWDDRHR